MQCVTLLVGPIVTVIVDDQRRVARLIPEAPNQDAWIVFGDLYRTLDDDTAVAVSRLW